MEKKPMISVIIPVFNVEKYLKRCVKSIQEQSYQDIEIILINDGSTDSSGRICDELALQDSRIELIHKENGGISSTRNVGLEHARGNWISFIDSDDFVHPDMLKTLLLCAVKNKVRLVICGFNVVNEDEIIQNTYNPPLQKLKGEELHKYFFEAGKGMEYLWNKLYDSNLLKTIRFPEGKIYEDTFVLPKILELSKKVAFVDWAGYSYTQRSSGISRNMDMNQQMDGLEAKQSKVRFMERNYPSLVPKAAGGFRSLLLAFV